MSFKSPVFPIPPEQDPFLVSGGIVEISAMYYFFLGRPGGLRRARLSPRFFLPEKAKKNQALCIPGANTAQLETGLFSGLISLIWMHS